MRGITELPVAVQHLVAVWLDGLDGLLGPRLHAAYLYGSYVFPGSWTQDVDADVIVTDAFDDDDREAVGAFLRTLHDLPLGDDMDVWYLSLDQARQRARPETQLRPGYRCDAWALHRAHIHAGASISLRGPDPTTILPEATWSEIDEALQDELEGLRDALARYPQYAVLNACRVLWSYTSGDVVTSKQEASDWALSTLPAGLHPAIRAAQATYARTATPQDRDVVAAGASDVLDVVEERVARLR